MTDLIFHHYPQSPVSEKVRIAFGMKGLAWHSVQIPRIPPKPDLMALTGGYRRTPVLQVGADIYCDSLCILREIERRHPTPTLFPNGSDGLAWAFAGWTDGPVFNDAVRLVLGSAADDLPADFAADRGRLYMGPDWDLKQEQANTSHLAAQVRSAFGQIESRLAGSAPYLMGDTAGLCDAVAYYLVWFVRGRWPAGPALLSEFTALERWEQSVQAIGHGTEIAMDSQKALQIARETSPDFEAVDDTNDPQGLSPGQSVSIAPDSDGGDPEVMGTLHHHSRDTVAILRTDASVGDVCVHFPRAGYRVTVL